MEATVVGAGTSEVLTDLIRKEETPIADSGYRRAPRATKLLSDKAFYSQKPAAFFRALAWMAGRVFKYSFLLRFALNVVVCRLDLWKACKTSAAALKLGLACSTFNVVYHFIRRCFAQRRKTADLRRLESVWLS